MDCGDCADQSYSCVKKCYTYEECTGCSTIELSSFCETLSYRAAGSDQALSRGCEYLKIDA